MEKMNAVTATNSRPPERIGVTMLAVLNELSNKPLMTRNMVIRRLNGLTAHSNNTYRAIRTCISRGLVTAANGSYGERLRLTPEGHAMLNRHLNRK